MNNSATDQSISKGGEAIVPGSGEVIITGASRGLGKAMAEKFAAGGNGLVLCSRNEEGLSRTMEELKRGFPAVSIRGRAFDLGKGEQAKQFGQWVLDQGVSIDILINNAGQFIPGSVHGEAEGVLEKMIGVN